MHGQTQINFFYNCSDYCNHFEKYTRQWSHLQFSKTFDIRLLSATTADVIFKKFLGHLKQNCQRLSEYPFMIRIRTDIYNVWMLSRIKSIGHVPFLTSFPVYRDVWRQTVVTLTSEAIALFNIKYVYRHSTQKYASFRDKVTCDQGRVGYNNVIWTEINSG